MDNLTKKLTEDRKRVIVGGKFYPDDLAVINARLKRFGYEKAVDLIRDFKDGKFPEKFVPTIQTSPENVNAQGSGQATIATSGASNVLEFCRNVDTDRLKRYYTDTLKLTPKYSVSCVNYFEKFYKVFFGRDPEALKKLTPHKRSWVVLSMRNFGKYSYYLTGNKDVKTAILEIIERFTLNEGLDHEHRIYLVDDNYVQTKVTAVDKIEGELGFFARFGIFSGVREDEILYMRGKEICDKTATCACPKLHVVAKPNGVTVVVLNWFRGQKKAYFTLLPSEYWTKFRATTFTADEIRITHKYLKSRLAIKYKDLRKLHYNVMVRTLEEAEAEVLAGRANAVSARHYALYELDRMSDLYVKAWEKFGVNIEQLGLSTIEK